MSKKILPWIIISFLLLAIIPFIPYLFNNKIPEQYACWNEPPLVVLCDDSLYSIEEVRHVLRKWEKRGYFFLDLTDEYVCEYEHITGVIMIRQPYRFIDEYAAGHANTLHKDVNIYSSIIEIREYTSLVLEHEIGHALGYKHVDRLRHIMFENVVGQGRNDSGLQKSESLICGG